MCRYSYRGSELSRQKLRTTVGDVSPPHARSGETPRLHPL
jgi:hypothetical protein